MSQDFDARELALLHQAVCTRMRQAEARVSGQSGMTRAAEWRALAELVATYMQKAKAEPLPGLTNP